MQFYRVESTEMLESGVNAYTFFVLPEGLDSFFKMFEKHKQIHHLGEPVLVEVVEDLEGGFIQPEGETNLCLFIGTR